MNTLQETVLLYLESNAHATRQLGNAAPINCRRRRRRRTLLLQTQARMCAIDKYDKNELLSSFFWIFQASKQQPTVLKRVSCARSFVRSLVCFFSFWYVRSTALPESDWREIPKQQQPMCVCLSVCPHLRRVLGTRAVVAWLVAFCISVFPSSVSISYSGSS